MTRPVFFYDLGSPACWVAAEAVGGGPEWVPVLGPVSAVVDRSLIEKAADDGGLGRVVWPSSYPFDSRLVMLAATFAKEAGRAVAFSLAAFRQAFLAGRDLSEVDNVLIAAAACELHPRALLKGIELRSVREALDEASAGVERVPALEIGGRVLAGPDALALIESRDG